MTVIRKIVVDGNDGLGKSTLIAGLRESGYRNIADRGRPTEMTDDDSVEPEDDEFYLILDGPVELSRQRLALAGRDLNERYHTVADLTHYRQRFLEVARRLPCHAVIDAEGTPREVLGRALTALYRAGLLPTDLRR